MAKSMPLLGSEPAENAQMTASTIAGGVISAFTIPPRWAGLVTMIVGVAAKVTTKLVKKYRWLD